MILIIEGVKLKCPKCGYDDFIAPLNPEPNALHCGKCSEHTSLASLLNQARVGSSSKLCQ
jgi:ribosomal protein S27AE